MNEFTGAELTAGVPAALAKKEELSSHLLLCSVFVPFKSSAVRPSQYFSLNQLSQSQFESGDAP